MMNTLIQTRSHWPVRLILSRSQAQTLIKDGAVLVNDTPITSPKKTNVGQLLLIKIPTLKAIDPEPQAVDFNSLEDEHLLVINNQPAQLFTLALAIQMAHPKWTSASQ